jgi:hypothetical protein
MPRRFAVHTGLWKNQDYFHWLVIDVCKLVLHNDRILTIIRIILQNRQKIIQRDALS